MSNRKDIEVEIRGSIPSGMEGSDNLDDKLEQLFGPGNIVRELVIFFKYGKDARLKLIGNRLEFILKKKKKDAKEKRGYLLEELIAVIPILESSSFVRLLSEIGYEEGLFSDGTRKEYVNSNGVFCIKEGTPIGDFFEFDRNIGAGEDEENVRAELEEIVVSLGLKPWTDEEYRINRSRSLAAMKPEPLVLHGGLINEKIKRFLFEALSESGRK